MPGAVGGSEVYARRLLDSLCRLAPELKLVVYAGPEAVESLSRESWAQAARFVTSPVSSRVKPLRVLAELSWLPARVRRDGVELLHSLGTTCPPFAPVPSVVTVLDVIYHHFPETFPRASRAGLRVVVPAGARRADRVISISEAGRRDAVETLRLDPARTDVVHLGFGMDGAPEPATEAEVRRRYEIGESQLLLTVSSALGHKNLPRLLEAFALVRADRDAKLAIVGHGGLEMESLRERADRLGVGDSVRLTGWIPGRELEGLYEAAALVVYPSLIEGFGMPVLEAMRRGVPVACSNASALPEVAGDAAELFDPLDPREIAAAVRRLLDDRERRAELVEKGRRRVSKFTWERAAEDTLEVYRRVLGQRGSH